MDCQISFEYLWIVGNIYFLKIKQIKCNLIKIKNTIQVFKCTPKANPENDIFFEIAQLPSSKKDGLDSDILLMDCFGIYNFN